MDWPESMDFRIMQEDEVTCAEEVPLCDKLPEHKKEFSLMVPVILWEIIRGGRLLCGVLHDKLQKLLNL